MSLDALGAAIQLERVRALRRPAPGGAPSRTREESHTPLAPFDEDFERAAVDRARVAEIRRTEIRSRIANHHLDQISRFRAVLEAADRAAESALALAERAGREDASPEQRAALSSEAGSLLATIPPLPAPDGPREPLRNVDLSTREGARRSARELERFRESIGRSSAQLDQMRDVVLDNVSELSNARRTLREIPNGRPSPNEMSAKVENVRSLLLDDPLAARDAQANLPRGLVLVMLRGR